MRKLQIYLSQRRGRLQLSERGDMGCIINMDDKKFLLLLFSPFYMCPLFIGSVYAITGSYQR